MVFWSHSSAFAALFGLREEETCLCTHCQIKFHREIHISILFLALVWILNHLRITKRQLFTLNTASAADWLQFPPQILLFRGFFLDPHSQLTACGIHTVYLCAVGGIANNVTKLQWGRPRLKDELNEVHVNCQSQRLWKRHKRSLCSWRASTLARSRKERENRLCRVCWVCLLFYREGVRSQQALRSPGPRNQTSLHALPHLQGRTRQWQFLTPPPQRCLFVRVIT